MQLYIISYLSQEPDTICPEGVVANEQTFSVCPINV